MYKKYLKLTLDNDICTDDYDYTDSKGMCDMCGSDCDATYITYVHEIKKKIKTCYLCHIVSNFKRYHTGKVLLCKSNMSQKDINIKTLKYFQKYNSIPLATKIDADCKMIKMQSYCFVKIYDQLNDNKKEIFNNVVIFFTNEVSKNLLKYKSSFFSEKKNDYISYDIKYFDIPEYKLTKKEICIIENSIKNDNISKVYINTKNNMKNKIKNAELSNSIINCMSKG
jgi:hypothetical protein